MNYPDKLQAIMLPETEFRQTSLCDVLEYLHHESHRLDHAVEDSSHRKGVPIGWLIPDEAAHNQRITLTFRDCNLGTVLAATAQAAGLALYVNESGAYVHSPVVQQSQQTDSRPPAAVAMCRAAVRRVRERLGI